MKRDMEEKDENSYSVDPAFRHIEFVETKTTFSYNKITGIILRFDTMEYIEWDRRFRNQEIFRTELER